MTDSQPVRVIVGLDLASTAASVVELAALLAASLRSELQGVFVEDEALAHAVALPFTSLVRKSGTLSPIDPPRLERELRLAAAEAQRALALAAKRAQLSATFRTARGRLLAQLLAASAEHDIIVVGGTLPTAFARQRGPVVAVFDRAAMGTPLLDLAAAIATARDRGLVVLVQKDDDPEPLRAAAAWAEHTPAKVRAVDVIAVKGIAGALKLERASLLLSSARSKWLRESSLNELREQAGCPLVLLR